MSMLLVSQAAPALQLEFWRLAQPPRLQMKLSTIYYYRRPKQAHAILIAITLLPAVRNLHLPPSFKIKTNEYGGGRD